MLGKYTRSLAVLSLLASAITALVPQLSHAAAFTAGNVVVYRSGDGVTALSSAAAPAFLDEYSPAGTLVQSIPLPTAVSGANKQCTTAGSSTSEGFLTRSVDGKYLVGPCYAAATGTAGVAGTTSAAVNRVVFRADSTGSVDTTTALSDYATGGNPRSATSSDGTSLWFSGSAGGVRYATFGATTSTQLSTTGTNLRTTEIFGGQLYVTTSSGAVFRIGAVGTGTPTSNGQTIVNLPGIPVTLASPYSIALLDLSPAVAGVDTMYVADDSATGGILKYSLVAGSWVSNGSIGPATDGYRGLTASVSGSTVTLFATSGTKLVTATDTAGYNAAPSAATTSLVASATGTSAFRGVALAPVNVVAPLPNLTVANVSAPEGNTGTSIASFTVSLDAPAPAGGVSFTINTADGTATAGSDYVAITSGSGNIAAGATSTTIPVTINGDTVFEGNETFTLNLSAITNTANATASATGTILDDDSAPTISIADASVIEGNTGTTTANFAVTLSNASTTAVTFTAQTVDGTATTADNDYVALNAATITIPAGAITGNIAVTVNGDTNIELDETFSLTLSNAVGGTLANTTATGTITNDDAVTPTFSINNVTQNEGDTGTSNFVFTVTSNVAAPAGGYTLNIATADGTATAGVDYVAANTTVTIAQGATTAPFSVVVNGDRTVEPNETFTVTLSNPPASTQLGTAVGTGTIVNDDVTPTLSIADVSVAEGNSGTSLATFTVSLDHPALDGGVAYTINTANLTATAGSDYVAIVNGSGTIAAGVSTATIGVTINGDTTFEPSETFKLNLSAITGATNTTASATGTITNDDTMPTLSVANISVMEGNSGTNPAVFTASLSSPAPAGGVTFTINTADGTATVADHDYVAIVNGTGTIAAGASSTTFTVTVNSDAQIEPNETFTVNLTAITNTTNATASATGTILNDDDVSIMEIQGHGTTSPYNGKVVTTAHNVVTALKSNGFFMQDPYGDGDLTTSDGIFVFTSSAPAVSIGNEVTVTGTVQEFSGSTEISFTPIVTVTNPLATAQPVPYALDSNPPTNDPTTGICMGRNSTINIAEADVDGYQASNFACLDGMLIAMNNAVVTGATFGNGATDGVHTGVATGMYVTLASQPHPFHGPGAMYPGIPGHPEIPVWNGEPEVLEIYYPGLSFNPAGFIYNAGTQFSTTGVIQGFKATGATSPIYEMYPMHINLIAAAPNYPQPVSDSAAGTLTIGSQNLLHFFNNTADGQDTSGYNDTCTGTGSNDTCPTASEYQARLSKWTHQICDVLKAPVVVDLEEIENLSVAHDLAASILAVAPPATNAGCGVAYNTYVIPGNDVSGINIGILVRSDVTVNSVTQMYKGTLTNNCSGATPCLLNDRPPVLMDATWNGYHFALLAIYDRSLSGLGDPTKPYIGPKRAEQAAQIASIAQAWQSGATLVGAGDATQAANGAITSPPASSNIVGIPSVPLIVAGDFNAYEFSDGYADVTGMITGTAVKSDNLYWYGAGYDTANTDTPTYVVPNPTLVDSGVRAAPGTRYSYNFSGLSQEIDHILLSRLAWKDFVSISNAHGDSDVSEASTVILDSTTAARSGDHDGQVVTIAIDRIFADGFDPQP